jgi:hypothetical protein
MVGYGSWSYGRVMKGLFGEVVEELWLHAAGIGAVVALAALVALAWAATIDAPDTATVFGSTVSCDAVNRDSGTLLSDFAGELSASVREAQADCAERPLKRLLEVAGAIFLPLGLLWTALWVYGGIHAHQRSTPTMPD